MTARVAPCGRRTRPVGRLLFSPRTHAHGREKKIDGRRGEAPPHRAPLTVTGSTAVKSPLVPYVRVKKNSPSHTHRGTGGELFRVVRSLRPGNAGPDSVVQRLRTKNPGGRAGGRESQSSSASRHSASGRRTGRTCWCWCWTGKEKKTRGDGHVTKAVPMAGVLVPPSRPRLFHLRVLFIFYISLLSAAPHRTVDWAAAAAGCLASFGLDGVVV